MGENDLIEHEYHVFRLNDDDLWVAESMESAIACACEEMKLERDELLDEYFKPVRITELEMHTETMSVAGQKLTYMEALKLLVASGYPIPCRFGADPGLLT